MAYIYAWMSGVIGGLVAAGIIVLWRYMMYHKKVKLIAENSGPDWEKAAADLRDPDISKEQVIHILMSSMHTTLAHLTTDFSLVLQKELGPDRAKEVMEAFNRKYALGKLEEDLPEYDPEENDIDCM